MRCVSSGIVLRRHQEIAKSQPGHGWRDLLGHLSGRITAHYSGAELSHLIDAANRVCERAPDARPELVVLRRFSVT